MAKKLLWQPNEKFRLGDFLKKNLSSDEWTEFRASVAFVKLSGVKHIADELAKFSTKAKVTITAGIDSGGSSRQGIAALLACTAPKGKVWIFHNAGTSTFHPKVFLFRNAKKAECVIGSGNLTEGGLFTNYEAAALIGLNLDEQGHKKFLDQIEAMLDSWSKESEGLCEPLTEDFLKKLIERGHLPPEQFALTPGDKKKSDEKGEKVPLFKHHKVNAPPKAPDKKGEVLAIGKKVPPYISEVIESSAEVMGFVMTLQQTDVGTGQKKKGAARRSPEIFIPLAARDYAPAFWGWPKSFVKDPSKPGKMDRKKVGMKVGLSVAEVNMMTWPDKHDFRLRSEVLRSAGHIGDLLRIECAPPGANYDYYVEVVPQGTTQYQTYLAYCSNAVRNSVRRWGYY